MMDVTSVSPKPEPTLHLKPLFVPFDDARTVRLTQEMMANAEARGCPTGIGFDRGTDGKSQFDKEYEGIGSETVVAETFGLPLSACDSLTRGTDKLDDGVDIILPGGVAADVKGSLYVPKWCHECHKEQFANIAGQLACVNCGTVHVISRRWILRPNGTPARKFIADVGILVALMPLYGLAAILGCVTRVRFLSQYCVQKVNVGHGPRYLIPYYEMDPIEVLLEGLRGAVGRHARVQQTVNGMQIDVGERARLTTLIEQNVRDVRLSTWPANYHARLVWPGPTAFLYEGDRRLQSHALNWNNPNWERAS